MFHKSGGYLAVARKVKLSEHGKVIAIYKISGLHHLYTRAKQAA
jgi:hypothetical protein